MSDGPDIGDLEGLKVEPPFGMSHSGGSGFNVSTIGECPRKAALRMLGWRQKLSKHYFGYGTIVHKHAFGPYIENPIPVNPRAVKAEVERMVWDEKYEDEYVGMDCVKRKEIKQIEPVSEKMRDDLPDIAEIQATVWDEMRYPADDKLAVEMLMSSDVIDPDTGNVPEDAQGVRILGRVDLVVKVNGLPAIRDLKTPKGPLSEEWTKELDYHRQLSTYRYTWASQFNQEIQDIAAFQLTKHKTEASIRKYAGEVPLHKPLKFHYIFETYLDAWRMVKAHEKEGRWPKHPHACEGKFSPCPFIPICWAEQFDDPNEYAKTLVRKERS